MRDRESENKQRYREIIVKYYSSKAFTLKCLYICRRRPI